MQCVLPHVERQQGQVHIWVRKAHLDNIGLVEQDAGNEKLPGVPKQLLLYETKGRLRRLPHRLPWVPHNLLLILLLLQAETKRDISKHILSPRRPEPAC